VNSYPYYDVFDESYATLIAMTEIMNEQRTHFVSKMSECGSLREIEPNLRFPRLEANLYDDWESSLSLESKVVDDARLIGLEEAFNYPLSSLSLVVSSTPIATSVSDLTLFASLLSLLNAWSKRCVSTLGPMLMF